ncbi:double-stranded DNA 3'-5' exodeoxyribonuclease [Aureococcus anophagefferens]|nr:double-stranded DNA 3'-5' exodeoxyribonuclease [Aureococcus anophagefferens]
MEGADDERSAVSSDLGDASEDEELGALGDFRPSALGLSPPPGRLFKSASSAASSSPTLSLPESFDNLGSVASGPGGAPRAPGNYLEYGLRQQLEAELQSATEKRHAEREAYGERLEALGRDNGQLRSRVESLGGELARVKRTLRDRRDAIDAGFRDGLAHARRGEGGDDAGDERVFALVEELRTRPLEELTLRELATAGLRTAAKLADCEIAKKRLEARLSFLEEQHGKSLDAAEAAHQRAVAAAEAKRADGADYRGAVRRAVREKRVALADAQKALAANADDFRARLEDRSAELAAATEKQITIIRSEREAFEARTRGAAGRRTPSRRAARARRASAASAPRRRPAPTPPRPSRRVADMAEAAAGVLAYELAASSTRLQGAERDAAAFKIENGALKEQVDVASREVAALEERLASSKRERDATVDGLEHKVRAYETLELELDSAVLRCADGTRGVDANGNVLASPELRDAALAAGLSRPERRVRHALKLADAAKPTQFLLSALADRDKAVAALRTKLHRADKAATDAANSADATAEHNARLETEILRLVKHRDELAQLRRGGARLRGQRVVRRSREGLA